MALKDIYLLLRTPLAVSWTFWYVVFIIIQFKIFLNFSISSSNHWIFLEVCYFPNICHFLFGILLLLIYNLIHFIFFETSCISVYCLFWWMFYVHSKSMCILPFFFLVYCSVNIIWSWSTVLTKCSISLQIFYLSVLSITEIEVLNFLMVWVSFITCFGFCSINCEDLLLCICIRYCYILLMNCSFHY